ncbi:hypothetical protein M2C68_19850, partial [Pseudomonas sp. BAgro211]|nr:hypothetical protein [Pseudomonas sp. BAgro211]
GGEGLSGTGPKAGGPLHLYRLLSTRPQDAVANQLKGDGAQALPRPKDAQQAVDALTKWAGQKDAALATLLGGYGELAQSFTQQVLTGPTG